MEKNKTIINCDGMTIYIDNPKKFVHKLLELGRECNMLDKSWHLKANCFSNHPISMWYVFKDTVYNSNKNIGYLGMNLT